MVFLAESGYSLFRSNKKMPMAQEQHKSSAREVRVSNNDVRLAEIKLRADRTGQILGAVKLLFVCATIVFSIAIVFEGLRPFLFADPANVNAISGFIQSFSLGTTMSIFLNLALGTGYAIERGRNKRGVKKINHFRSKVESKDEYKASSGLNDDGSTPE